MRRGLVLQGGGARGAYQVGAWKALRELGIDFHVITGTSIGSLNGAIMAQDEFDKCYDIWYNLNPNTLIEGDAQTYLEVINANIDLKDTRRYFDYFKNIVLKGGLDIDPLIELINEVVDEDKIRKSPIKVGLVTVSITDMEAYQLFVDEMEEGMLKDYLIASSFLPFFKSVELHGKRFIDGGIYDNFPLKLMLSENVDEIITIELSSYNIKPSLHKTDVPIKRIIPSGDLGNRFSFSSDVSRKGLKMGYLDTMKAYGKFGGFKYFLSDVYDENDFDEIIHNLNIDKVNRYIELIGEKESKGKRGLYEILMPKVAKMLGSGSEDSYLDIYIRALERLAKTNEVDRLEEYSFKDFSDLIIKTSGVDQETAKDFSNIPEILKRSSLVKTAYVDYLIYEFVEMIHEACQKNR